jgi:hypothetical protein
VRRLPAQEIERQVVRRLEALFATGRELLDRLALPADDAAARKALLAGAKAWRDLGTREPAQVRAFFQATLRRVTVEENAMQIALSRSGLRTVLFHGGDMPDTVLKPPDGREEADEVIPLTVNVTLRRSGGVTRLLVPGEPAETRAAKPNTVLIKAVARAHAWSERLLSGTSIHAIALEHHVTDHYVAHILRAAFLAPDLVEAILHGRQPPELTLKRLLDDLPLDWAAQREALGPI